MDGDGETMSPLPAPRPRVFPVSGISSTPRCGHTLTALAGPDGDLQGARLVLFGEASAGRLSRPSPIAISTCSTRAVLASCRWSGLPVSKPCPELSIASQVARRRWRAPRSPGTAVRQPRQGQQALAQVGIYLWLSGSLLPVKHNIQDACLDARANGFGFWPAGIRLAGATSDVHIMDVRTGKWERANVQGEPPSPRAAHAAAAVGSMVVVQVGLACVAGLSTSHPNHVSTMHWPLL